MSGLSKKSIAIAVVILLLVSGAGWFFLMRGNSESNDSTESTEAVFPTSDFEEPTPTPEATLNKEDIKIKVLNGSGVVGEANRVKLILEDADFTVDSTDNAESYDASETTIAAKSGVMGSVVSELKKLLEDDYTVTTTSLDASESVDIIITVGSRINPPTKAPSNDESEDTTPTPTKSPTPTP